VLRGRDRTLLGVRLPTEHGLLLPAANRLARWVYLTSAFVYSGSSETRLRPTSECCVVPRCPAIARPVQALE
jgi:hypothetical protein